MLQSQLFPKTLKNAPKEATSASHKFLVQGGYVDMLQAGVYTYLPLAWRVINNINKIVREEMNAEGGQELLMPALQSKGIWEETGRWSTSLKDVMYQFKDASGKELGLAATHEEVVYDLIRKFINSYKDLPLAVYQIQNKFRAELRAKGGLMRGREFMMKDLYSFHLSQADLNDYYNKMIDAYKRVYNRCGLEAKVVEASGGVFTDKFSHEFQVVSEAGEDRILYCDSCDFAQNSEISELKVGDKCPSCGRPIKEGKSIEVGNIFNFGDKYAKDMNGYVNSDKGEKLPIWMASYGIGISRLVATIVEIHHDDAGIIWPESVAPFKAHLISIKQDEAAQKIYDELVAAGIEVLYDNRDVSAGQKFADSDLLGIPWRLVVSGKNEGKIEVKKRDSDKTELLETEEIINKFSI
ncbi:MAG: proline--tRNA ligase [Candidatus Buchananbacteria bacterium]